MKKIFFLASLLFIESQISAQIGTAPSNSAGSSTLAGSAWYRGGNLAGGTAGNNNIFGTRWASDIWIMTNSQNRARFTHGSALTSPWDVFAPFDPIGDGLKIIGGGGDLDLFTGNNGTTHVRFATSGSISGQNGRFEQYANFGGFFFNTVGGGVYKFARGGTVTGFVGTNNFWRIGEQNDLTNLPGQRRLHVVDNTTQFRLSFSPPDANGGLFTDFLSNNAGNLQIQPSGGRVGINANANPTATIDVFGDARIRNVQAAVPNSILIGVNADGASDVNVRRLDFTGNSNQVLLGNGTWGTLPPVTPVITTNNGILNTGGVLQLGAPCNNGAALFASAITQDRSVFLTNGNSFWFSTFAASTGGIGLGAQPASTPFCGVGNTVEISANNASAYGTTNSSGLRFTQLNSGSTTIPNGTNGVNSTKVLTVDGNGDVVLTNSNSSFGVNCSDNVNGILDQDKKVNLNNNSFYIEDPTGVQTLGENRFGIGYTCGNQLPGKISSFQLHSSNVNIPTFAGHFVNKDIHTIAPQPGSIIVGVYGEATGVQLPNNIINNLGGQFLASNARFNTGVRTTASSLIGQFTRNIGISSFSINGQSSSGVVTNASGGILTNTGVLAQAFGSSTQNNTGGSFFAGSSNLNNYGMRSSATGGQNAYGVYSSASGATGVNRAGYFIGIVEGTSGGIFTSDSIFKDSISKLPAALNIIEMLSPKQYVMDAANYPRFNFDNKTQFGFIAQEVEQVLPNLVYQSHMPAEYDS